VTSADLSASSFTADPYPLYAALRAEAPARRLTLPSGVDAWLVTRYAEARRVLADSRLAKDPALMRAHLKTPPPEGDERLVGRHMLHADPPAHTRLRRLVSRVFTPRRVDELRPHIQQVAGDLLERMAAGSTADLINTLAFPLPIAVICELLGVPLEDRQSFRQWSDAIVAGYVGRERDPEAFQQLSAYLGGLIATKRRALGTDLLSDLIAVRDADDRLSETELRSMVFLLLIAGHETTVNLIGNATYLLLTHPEQWTLLRAEPDRVPAAVEEALRYDSPVQTATLRVTRQPVSLDGITIPSGELVLVCVASANRDGARIADPDRFDLTRRDLTHLSFGHGIHFCLGAPLARVEAEVALRGLLAHFPDLTLALPAHRLAWRPGMFMRGLVSLPVRW
jgi:cytochrome P450